MKPRNLKRVSVSRPGKRTVESVTRALRILDELGATTRFGLTFSELRDNTRIPNGSLHYLLNTLIESKYVRYHKQNKLHTLGLPLMSLGQQVFRTLNMPEQATMELLLDIRTQEGLGAHLAILDGDDAVYVQRIEAPSFFVAKIWPGKRQIPHVTAIGKALICRCDKDRVREIMERHDISHEKFPKAKRLDDLWEELLHDRERGYSMDDEEHEANVRCVASPVYGEKEQPIAAIGITGTTAQLSLERAKTIGEMLNQRAADFSRQLKTSKRFRNPNFIQRLVDAEPPSY